MFTDIKYLGFLKTRLKNFVKKDSRLYNCACPICGDGSDSRKARGYFMPKKKGEGLYYFCHLCNVGMPFSRFLDKFDSTLYQEYRRERLQSKYSSSRHKKDLVVEVPKFNTERLLKVAKEKSNLTDHLQNMAEMPKQWRDYLVGRKIPQEILWKYFYYTDDFKKIANILRPGTFSKKACFYKEARIVILMIDANGSIGAIQGRETSPSSAKYITIKASDESRKIFGLDRIKMNQPVFVLEGPIDSAFLDNAIGVSGADLVSQVAGLKIKPIFCFDNEPRSTIIIKKIESAIARGHNVVIFPSSIPHKDLNDMVLHGVDVKDVVKRRTFVGLRAQTELNRWKKSNNRNKGRYT